jgi:hypothetical protein
MRTAGNPGRPDGGNDNVPQGPRDFVTAAETFVIRWCCCAVEFEAQPRSAGTACVHLIFTTKLRRRR